MNSAATQLHTAEFPSRPPIINKSETSPCLILKTNNTKNFMPAQKLFQLQYACNSAESSNECSKRREESVKSQHAKNSPSHVNRKAGEIRPSFIQEKSKLLHNSVFPQEKTSAGKQTKKTWPDKNIKCSLSAAAESANQNCVCLPHKYASTSLSDKHLCTCNEIVSEANGQSLPGNKLTARTVDFKCTNTLCNKCKSTLDFCQDIKRSNATPLIKRLNDSGLEQNHQIKNSITTKTDVCSFAPVDGVELANKCDIKMIKTEARNSCVGLKENKQEGNNTVLQHDLTLSREGNTGLHGTDIESVCNSVNSDCVSQDGTCKKVSEMSVLKCKEICKPMNTPVSQANSNNTRRLKMSSQSVDTPSSTVHNRCCSQNTTGSITDPVPKYSSITGSVPKYSTARQLKQHGKLKRQLAQKKCMYQQPFKLIAPNGRINVKMGGFSYATLIDSGASMNVISNETVTANSYLSKLERHPTNHSTAETATGENNIKVGQI